MQHRAEGDPPTLTDFEPKRRTTGALRDVRELVFRQGDLAERSIGIAVDEVPERAWSNLEQGDGVAVAGEAHARVRLQLTRVVCVLFLHNRPQ